jgi:hypothetical protein
MTTALLPRGRRRALVPLFLVALFLASCSRDVASTIEASAPPDMIVVGKPHARAHEPEREHVPVGRPALVGSRDDLVDESRVLPDDVWVDSADPTQLRLRFTAGAAPCTGVRVSVDAGPATVGVALYVGTPPEHTDTICDASARVLEVRATLDRPLGTRELIWRLD